MPSTRDVVIVGAGHNGLVTAYYLAKAGLKPLVLERRPVAGGAAITDEFYPGFRCSTLSHSAGPLSPEVVRDMKLERHGLRMIQPDVRVLALSRDDRALILYDDLARCAGEIAKFSPADAGKFPEFGRALVSMAQVIGQAMTRTPPPLDRPTPVLDLIRNGKAFRSLGKKNMYRLLRWAPMPVADLVGEWFETELLRATVAARGIFGTFLGPWSAGSGTVLLMRATADPHPAGATAFIQGGMGALPQAMAAAAREAGAEIKTSAEVARIHVKDGSVTGVVLGSGEEVAAKLVISNADPRRTLLRLIDPVHLDPGFVVRMQNYRCSGTVAKLNLALAGLPRFSALREGIDAGALAGRIHVGPEIDYLERAFDDAKYGDFSRQPVLDITMPSLTDASLAPPGQHVMSVYVQFAPFKLKAADWNAERDAFADVVVRTLAAYAPDLPNLILHLQVITPLDLEETYGLTGGHIFHGELALDQLYAMRPLLGWARYAMPIDGLYLCGSGTHPGSGLTGLSGANAARQILKDWKKRKRG